MSLHPCLIVVFDYSMKVQTKNPKGLRKHQSFRTHKSEVLKISPAYKNACFYRETGKACHIEEQG